MEKDSEFSKLDIQKRNEILTQLYNFYKAKASSGKVLYNYELDFDKDPTSKEVSNELNFI